MDKIPAIPKLLRTDYKTLINAKKLLNDARNKDKLMQAVIVECRSLSKIQCSDEFRVNLANYQ